MNEIWFLGYRWVIAPLGWAIFQMGKYVGGPKWKALLAAKNSGSFHLKNLSEEKIRDLRPLWVHASSGEIEYARPVIRRWKEMNSSIPVVVTYGSPSAIRILQKMAEVDAWGAVPWESPAEINKFLDRFHPRALFVARTDVWPVLISEVKKRKIPSLLFAATFAAKSSRLTGPMRPLTADSLAKLDAIHVVSEDDRDAIDDLVDPRKITVAGDTRFDQVTHRLQNPASLTESLRPTSGPTFVAGSTWPEDEEIILPAIKRNPEWKLLLAPHEISEARLAALEDKMRKLGLTFQRYSKGGQWTKNVLLLDQIGILAELYTWGNLAFVGGSFRKLVHSVMEPLAAGLRVLVGPKHLNNREALEFKKTKIGHYAAVHEIGSAQELQKLLEDPRIIASPDEVRMSLRRHQGATDKVLAWARSRVP